MTMPLIGTDVSIEECRASGYVVMNPAGLMDSQGKLRKDRSVRITVSIPEMWPYGQRIRGVSSHELYRVNDWFDFNELWELFQDQGDGIKQYGDWENCPIEVGNPTEHDMLNLASLLVGYCGLSSS